MINDTLQQLKIKPIPKPQDKFNIILTIPQQGVAPKIIDKTSEKLINRDQFFSDIQDYLEVVQKGYKKLPKTSTIKDDISEDKTQTQTQIPNIINTFSQIVKTGAKIVITNPSEQTTKKSKIKLPNKERLTPKPGQEEIVTKMEQKFNG